MTGYDLKEFISGEDFRLRKSDNPFLETGYMGSAIALFSMYRIKQDGFFLSMAEYHLALMRETLKDKVALEINNGLTGVGLGITWLVEEGFLSGDLNSILKEMDDRVYKYSVMSFNEYNQKYESTYIDMLIYISVRLNYLKVKHAEYAIFTRLAQMLYDHIYLNISIGFLMEPSPSNIRYKLFLFIVASWLLCRNGDSHLKNRVTNVFNEIYDVIVTVHPFWSVNRFMLHLAIERLLPYIDTSNGKLKEYSLRLFKDISIVRMLEESLENDMSVFHGIPYIYLLLKFSKTNIPRDLLNDMKSRIEHALSLYSDYNECEKWDYVGLSGIMGTTVILEDIKFQLSNE